MPDRLTLLIERRDDRLVREVGVDREGNRPERTTYALTDAGREIVDAWLRRTLPSQASEDQFRVALAECHNLPQAEVRELVTIRRGLLAAELDSYVTALAQASDRQVPPIYLVEVQRQAHLVRAELAWLDDFLTQLGTPGLGWPE